jgi:hypothetical protein
MKQLILAALTTLTLASCTKEIEIDLNSSDAKIVIEGDITDEPGPYFVKLSKTVNFSDAGNYPAVSNALVVIADDRGTIDTLTETTKGTYSTARIVGTPGTTYKLTVEAEGRTYHATSTMPLKVPLDSLRFNVFSAPGSSDNYTVIPVFLDPDSKGNCYRFIQKVNDETDKSYIVVNDNVANGTVNQRPIFSRDLEVKSGADVTIEMRCIDPNAYLYFYSLAQIAGNGPGGGTTPSNPPNNITGNGALGLFAAFSVQKVSQKAP